MYYSDQPAVTADYLVFKIREEVPRNPFAPVVMNSRVSNVSYSCLTQVRPEIRFCVLINYYLHSLISPISTVTVRTRDHGNMRTTLATVREIFGLPVILTNTIKLIING